MLAVVPAPVAEPAPEPIDGEAGGGATAGAAVDGADVARRDEVRREAYLLAERRGFAPGGEVDDWLEAERLVAARLDGEA